VHSKRVRRNETGDKGEETKKSNEKEKKTNPLMPSLLLWFLLVRPLLLVYQCSCECCGACQLQLRASHVLLAHVLPTMNCMLLLHLVVSGSVLSSMQRMHVCVEDVEE